MKLKDVSFTDLLAMHGVLLQRVKDEIEVLAGPMGMKQDVLNMFIDDHKVNKPLFKAVCEELQNRFKDIQYA